MSNMEQNIYKNVTNRVKQVFDIEISELKRVKESINDSVVSEAVRLMNGCTGKIILCGMGKPGHIGRKISATMSSMGISSYFLHPAEAQHGDLGTVNENDILFIISNSGETAEICKMLPNVKLIGAKIIALTSYEKSTLAQYADVSIILPVIKEATALQLAPTSSTTCELVIGDALAAVLSELVSFKKEDFALYHPAGSLGRKLTIKVSDLMYANEKNPAVHMGVNLKDAICAMSKTGVGAINIIDDNNHLCGLITDGDLKRYLENGVDIYSVPVDYVMTKTPITILPNILAYEALRIMEKREKKLSVLPVVNEIGESIGMLRLHDIISLGII